MCKIAVGFVDCTQRAIRLVVYGILSWCDSDFLHQSPMTSNLLFIFFYLCLSFVCFYSFFFFLFSNIWRLCLYVFSESFFYLFFFFIFSSEYFSSLFPSKKQNKFYLIYNCSVCFNRTNVIYRNWLVTIRYCVTSQWLCSIFDFHYHKHADWIRRYVPI